MKKTCIMSANYGDCGKNEPVVEMLSAVSVFSGLRLLLLPVFRGGEEVL
jgi:hypothetical protein